MPERQWLPGNAGWLVHILQTGNNIRPGYRHTVSCKGNCQFLLFKEVTGFLHVFKCRSESVQYKIIIPYKIPAFSSYHGPSFTPGICFCLQHNINTLWQAPVACRLIHPLHQPGLLHGKFLMLITVSLLCLLK